MNQRYYDVIFDRSNSSDTGELLYEFESKGIITINKYYFLSAIGSIVTSINILNVIEYFKEKIKLSYLMHGFYLSLSCLVFFIVTVIYSFIKVRVYEKLIVIDRFFTKRIVPYSNIRILREKIDWDGRECLNIDLRNGRSVYFRNGKFDELDVLKLMRTILKIRPSLVDISKIEKLWPEQGFPKLQLESVEWYSNDGSSPARSAHIHVTGGDESPEGVVLKSCFKRQLTQHKHVLRGYLVQTTYGADESLGLCLKLASEPERGLVYSLLQVFSDEGWPTARVAFLTENQEDVLRTICGPFYEKT